MCFVLYMATRSWPPTIPWNERNSGLWTTGLTEHDAAVRSKFTLPCVTYVGSDQNCGCGFRHAMFQGGGWPEESLADEPDYDPGETQPNHDALVWLLLGKDLSEEPFIELYGLWDGDFDATAEDRQEISVSQIAHPRFHFRERAFYRVTGLTNVAPTP
jgi:hypothetical protein